MNYEQRTINEKKLLDIINDAAKTGLTYLDLSYKGRLAVAGLPRRSETKTGTATKVFNLLCLGSLTPTFYKGFDAEKSGEEMTKGMR